MKRVLTQTAAAAAAPAARSQISRPNMMTLSWLNFFFQTQNERTERNLLTTTKKKPREHSFRLENEDDDDNDDDVELRCIYMYISDQSRDLGITILSPHLFA